MSDIEKATISTAFAGKFLPEHIAIYGVAV
jgi:hypothetical protein